MKNRRLRYLAALGLTLVFTLPSVSNGVANANAYSLDRRKVVATAIYYAGPGRDFAQNYRDYANLAHSDCTNFASNSVRVGGGLDRDTSNHGDNTDWFSHYTTEDYQIVRTTTWTTVYDFWHYFQDTRKNVYFTKVDPTSDFQDADLGDIILYDVGDKNLKLDHINVETNFGPSSYPDSGPNGDPSFDGDLVSQHSPHRVNTPWNYWYYHYAHDSLRAKRMRDHGFYIMHWKYGYNGYNSGTS